MHPCPFCSIVVGRGPARKIFEDDHTMVFFPLVPATPGHTLVVPRARVPDLWAMAPAAAERLLATALRVGAVLRGHLTPPVGMNVMMARSRTCWSRSMRTGCYSRSCSR